MKRTFIFSAWLLLAFAFSALAQGGGTTLMTGTQTQQVEGQKIFHSSGNQGTSLIGWSQSGASAAVITQDTHFDNAALLVQRTGTDGDTTSTPTLRVLAGKETAGNQFIFETHGCTVTGGDN